MTWLQFFGYLSDVWVLTMYWWLTRTGKASPFHLANALGALPLLIAEVQLGAWQVLPLTGTFCLLGWYGLLKAWRDRPGVWREVAPGVHVIRDEAWTNTDSIGDR